MHIDVELVEINPQKRQFIDVSIFDFIEGQGELLLAKWLSVQDHVSNHHDDFNNELFKQCAHGELESEDYEWI